MFKRNNALTVSFKIILFDIDSQGALSFVGIY